jgi:cell surface protein SprA
MYQYSVSSNLELGKLLPEKAGIRIPFYGGISQIFSTPEFDPYQLDVSSKTMISSLKPSMAAILRNII